MSRVVLCAVEEVPEGTSRVFEFEDVSIVVARSGSAVFALEDRCSHDDGEFEDARILVSEGRTQIECPRHGGRFDLATGRATRMPAVAPVEAFRAGVEDGRIWVEMPEE